MRETPPPVRPLSDDELDAPLDLFDGGTLPDVAGYDLVRELGRGGQAVVYLATELGTGREVAIKVLPEVHLVDPSAAARFAREAWALAGLDHPGVVVAAPGGRTAGGSPYLVQRYVRGVPLDEFAAGLADDAAVALLFARLADAVSAVHDAGVVHRDLKPANVLVDRAGQPHVLDFGLAGLTSAVRDAATGLTRAGQVVGSIPWASPEQVGRGRPDERSDVYAIGLLLCVSIADGHAPPYATRGWPHEIVERILNASPAVAGRAEGDPLAAVALRCLAKRPGDRYASVAALACDLRAVAAGRLPGRTPPPSGRPARPAVAAGVRPTARVLAIAAVAACLSGSRAATTRSLGRGPPVLGRRGVVLVRLQATAGEAPPRWITDGPVTWGQLRAAWPAADAAGNPGDPAVVDRATALGWCRGMSALSHAECSLPDPSDAAAGEWSASPRAGRTPTAGRRAFHAVVDR